MNATSSCRRSGNCPLVLLACPLLPTHNKARKQIFTTPLLAYHIKKPQELEYNPHVKFVPRIIDSQAEDPRTHTTCFTQQRRLESQPFNIIRRCQSTNREISPYPTSRIQPENASCDEIVTSRRSEAVTWQASFRCAGKLAPTFCLPPRQAPSSEKLIPEANGAHGNARGQEQISTSRDACTRPRILRTPCEHEAVTTAVRHNPPSGSRHTLEMKPLTISSPTCRVYLSYPENPTKSPPLRRLVCTVAPRGESPPASRRDS